MQLIPAHSIRTRPLVIAACLLLFSVLFAAAAPGNDQCAGAVVIPNAGPFPLRTEPLSLDGAGNLGDPPFPPPQTSFDTNITRSVWYKFTPATNGLYTFSTGYDTETNFKDTSMVMYTAGADCANFTIYAFNDDSGTLRSAISTSLTAGTAYYIVIWIGSTEVITTGLELQLRVTMPAIPPNDNCANPIIIPNLISVPHLTPVVDTTRATTAALVSPPCVTNHGAMPSREVWYQFTPAVTGTYNFSTGPETATRIEDTSIALYTLTAGNCNAPNQVACNDNSFGRARFSFDLTASVTYHIAVYDNASNYVAGETDLQLSVAPAMAPTVVTLPPSSLTSTGATLNGTITANGVVPTRFWFEWGSTTNLGSSTRTNFIFNRDLLFTTNVIVSGFAPGAIYHYRMVGSNSLGKTEGQLQTFAFISMPPQIATFGFDENLGSVYRIEFGGAARHLYVVEGSTDLVNWIVLGPADEDSPTSFLFLHSATEPRRFYRVRQP